MIVGAGQTPGQTVGNGRAVAVTFAREGARLVLVDRHEERARETADLAAAAADGEGHDLAAPVVLAVDIASDEGPAHVAAGAVEAFGGFDILHNNVGIGMGDGPPHHLTDAGFDRIMDINLRAMWRTCREAVPILRAERRSAIVNVSSLGSVAAAQNQTAYKLSKAGVDALTQNLALTGAKHGMRANAILPGFIDTPMAVDAAAIALEIDRDEYAAARASMVPIGRQGSAWDVANAALFLASEEAGFITGVCLPVDGGQSARVG